MLNLIKQLRERTGLGMMDCKKALEESNKDIEKAIEFLRKAGTIKAAKKAERETKEGLIDSYIHPGGRIGALVKVNCETDFVARNEEFKTLVHNIAVQIAASDPQFLKPEDIPEEIKEKEKDIFREQLKKEKKPEAIMDKIIEGKLQKFYSEVCLIKQPFFKEEKITVEELINQTISKLGENIQIAEFTRYKL
ncbi:MAG: translation elongation factor Ts [Candidatus Kuenenbacteria bacterium]